jgi:hypothetical protein
VLRRPRAAAFVALFAVVWTYYELQKSLPDLPHGWDVALLVFPIMPAVLALVWLALPLWTAPAALQLGLAALLALLAFGFDRAGFPIAGNFCKLFAPVLAGWWFFRWFETVWWVVIVACLIPVVDIYSVFWGPTEAITKNHPSVYFGIAFAFVVPHSGAASIGPPDLLFFAVFLAAAVRFELRERMTFVLMTLALGATVAVANAAGIDGLPALPFLSVGFLLGNADVLWRRRGEVLPLRR